MRISDNDIVRTAQELRDEENRQLHVRPWRRNRHSGLPVWLTAVPAAAVIGFLFGVWTNSQYKPELPLTALADTVYVTVKETPASTDSTHSPDMPLPARHAARPVRSAKVGKHGHEEQTGQSMLDDRIRYDLLVKN